MKKVKNTEIRNGISLEHIKEGKIKKNKQKKDKKLKNAVSKMDLNFAGNAQGANIETISDGAGTKKSKSTIKIQNQEPTKRQIVANNENKDGKRKKQKNAPEKISSKGFTETEKLAKKLKKQIPSTIANGENNLEMTDTNGVNAATSITILKKEKKAQKKQLIKDQKREEKHSRDPAKEAATVFVGNLRTNTKRVQLLRLFKDFAPVISIRLRTAGGKVMFKHKQRKTAGTLNAYVVLKDKEAAEKALSLNGMELKGHHIRVTLAETGLENYKQENAKRTVFVGNLKYSATEESLREIFSSCGEIDYVRCIRDGDKGCKGIAYVCFKATDAVGLALELNNTIVDERPINVERFNGNKLGAKAARAAKAEKEKQSEKGAKKRINNKNAKKEKPGHEKDNSGEVDYVNKPKKSEFRGVKVQDLKKKQKSKKKKSNDQMLQLAKKIAPKIKTE